MNEEMLKFYPKEIIEYAKNKNSEIIPKDTIYCYNRLEDGMTKENCPYYAMNPDVDYWSSGYCLYLNIGDWNNVGTGLLFDQCKECGVSAELTELYCK